MAKNDNSTALPVEGASKEKKVHVRSQDGIGKFIDALGNVYSEATFFYYILKGIKIEETGDIPTMAVMMRKGDKLPTLLYNSNFLEKFKYKDDQDQPQEYIPTRADTSGVILHEALHLCLRHLQRRILTHNQKVSNIAMDVLVNYNIPQLATKGYHGKTLGDFSMNKEKFVFLKDIELDNINYPDLYDLMMKELPKQKIDLDALEKMIKNGQIQIDDHPWEDGDLIELDDEAKARFEDLMKSAAKQCERDNRWGNVPGEVMRYVKELIKPKTSWRNTIEYFIQTCRLDTTIPTWKKYSRRYGNRAAGRKSDNAPNLLIGVDTSGSIGQETYDLFASYMDYAIQQCQSVRIVFCDTEISVNKIYEAGTKEHLKPPRGGGGTMLMPIFDVAKKEGVDGVILLTDGYHEQLNTYGIPTIALTCPGGVASPGIQISVPLDSK